jgi:FkbM family methyltransferase
MEKLIIARDLIIKPLIIYGHGNGFNTFKSFVLDKCKSYQISYIVDSKYDKIVREEILFINPSDTQNIENKDKYHVIICIGNELQSNIVKTKLLNEGFRKILFPFNFYEYHSCYEFGSSDEIKNKFNSIKHKIEIIKNKLSDQESLDVLRNFIDIFYNYKIPKIPKSNLCDEYVEPNIKFFSNEISSINLINCGSYDGDTVRQIHKRVGKIGGLVCFEPNPIQFELLQQYLFDNTKNLANFVIAQKIAIGDEDGLINLDISLGMNSNSKVSNADSKLIKTPIMCLDNCMLNFPVTNFIIDIEGNEKQMLRGADKIIKKYKPNFAISVYHYPTDIIEIPFSLLEYNLNYKLYLRNYTGHNSGTVLYAIK